MGLQTRVLVVFEDRLLVGKVALHVSEQVIERVADLSTTGRAALACVEHRIREGEELLVFGIDRGLAARVLGLPFQAPCGVGALLRPRVRGAATLDAELVSPGGLRD